jgi:hypothetical protein
MPSFGWMECESSQQPLQIVAVRSTSSAALTVASIWHMRHQGAETRYFGKKENYRLLLSRGLCGATAMTLYYFSIQSLQLGDAVTIFFTNVPATAIASVLCGYERFSWIMSVGVSACLGTFEQPVPLHTELLLISATTRYCTGHHIAQLKTPTFVNFALGWFSFIFFFACMIDCVDYLPSVKVKALSAHISSAAHPL